MDWKEKFPFNFEDVESSVQERPGAYRGISPEALFTDPEDYEAIFKELPHLKSWVELGSGVGLGPLMFALLHPEGLSFGIEFDESRYKAGEEMKRKTALKNVFFQNEDLLYSDIPVGEAYFMYLPTGPVLDRILSELGTREGNFKIIVIESHGDLLPRIKKENWLDVLCEIPLKSSRHYPHAVFFEKIGVKRPSIHDVSFLERYFLIEEEGKEWIGESYGMEWIREDEYQCLIPPRGFHLQQLKGTYGLEDLNPLYHHALRLRHLGVLTIKTRKGEFHGFIRKIFVTPSFKVEISSGQLLEWKDVTHVFWENQLCYESSSGYFYYPPAV